MLKWRRESILDVYKLLIGAFLFLSPWLFAYTRGDVRIETWVSSVIVVTISIAALTAFSDWEEWANLAVGVWLIASPWLLGFAHTTAMHWSIGIGLVVAYLSVLELWLIHYESPAARPSPPS